MEAGIEITHQPPGPEEYINLRVAAGLSPKDRQAASIALDHSIFAVYLRKNEELIGMGRIIGDYGCFYQLVDIAVIPDMQGLGLGRVIMDTLTDYLNNHLPPGAYVSLIADLPADKLYQKYGFEYTSPQSVGMYRKI